MKSVWLLDGHLLATRIYFADRTKFVANFCLFLDGLHHRATREHPHSQIVTVFDNHQHRSWRTAHTRGVYKGQRKAQETALREGIRLVRENFMAQRGWLHKIAPPGLEGDDVLAKLAVRYSRTAGDQLQQGGRAGAQGRGQQSDAQGGSAPCGSVVVSGDKDLLQLVAFGARVLDPFTQMAQFSSSHPDEQSSHEEAVGDHYSSDIYARGLWMTPERIRAKYKIPHDRIAELLALWGDLVDGVRGVKGVGEQSARTLLNHPRAEGRSLQEIIKDDELIDECNFRPGIR